MRISWRHVTRIAKDYKGIALPLNDKDLLVFLTVKPGPPHSAARNLAPLRYQPAPHGRHHMISLRRRTLSPSFRCTVSRTGPRASGMLCKSPMPVDEMSRLRVEYVRRRPFSSTVTLTGPKNGARGLARRSRFAALACSSRPAIARSMLLRSNSATV